jgi:putative oxidoreductase
MSQRTTELFSHRGVFPEVARRGLSEVAPETTFPWGERIPVLERYGALAGRILIALIFVLSGTMKFMDWSGTAASMAKHGLPLINLLLPAAALTELLGGLSILLGFRSRIGAFVLFLFLIPTTLIFHAFWNYQGEMFPMQMANFMKNLAIMGGLWLIVTFGSGMCSLDGWLRKPQPRTT